MRRRGMRERGEPYLPIIAAEEESDGFDISAEIAQRFLESFDGVAVLFDLSRAWKKRNQTLWLLALFLDCPMVRSL